MQAHNLTYGWWGFVSFFGTILFLIDNRKALLRGTEPLRNPLPPKPGDDKRVGRPVFARRPVIAMLALLLTVVVGISTGGFGIDIERWEVGDCVKFSGPDVAVVPCGYPPTGTRVLAIVDDVFTCPGGSEFIASIRGGQVACLG